MRAMLACLLMAAGAAAQMVAQPVRGGGGGGFPGGGQRPDPAAFGRVQQGQRGQQNQQQQREVTPGKSSIEGTVINSVTHEPIKKADVRLSGTASMRAVTDASGRFAFRLIPAGQYVLNASAAQFPQQMFRPPTMIRVGDEDEKTGIELPLTPGGSVSGSVADEEGNPLPGCNMAVMSYEYMQGDKRLMMRGSVTTDDRGQFRINDVSPGRYYVMARCFTTIPLPHAFTRRGPDTEIPTLAYEPILYPGSPDLSSATTVSVQAGRETGSIDFRMNPAAGITLRGRVSSMETEGMQRFTQVMLLPQQPELRDVRRKNAPVNQRNGTFRFEHVLPGAYEVIGIARNQDAVAMGRTQVQVGATEPPPVELVVERPPSVKGNVVVEAEPNTQMPGAMRVMFQPRGSEIYGPPPNAEVAKDGTFTLQNASAGKWTVMVPGVPGYVKSVKVGDREFEGGAIELGSGSPGSMTITVSTKWSQVTGTVTGMASTPMPTTGLLLPASGQIDPMMGNRMFTVGADGTLTAGNLQPGEYHLCVLPTGDAWQYARNIPLMEALRSRCSKVEVKEGQTATVQAALIPAADFARYVEESER